MLQIDETGRITIYGRRVGKLINDCGLWRWILHGTHCVYASYKRDDVLIQIMDEYID